VDPKKNILIRIEKFLICIQPGVSMATHHQRFKLRNKCIQVDVDVDVGTGK
jgi:hypothetical protein